ncbi:MAG: sarcosine oxidase subunit alpha family protein [Gammaproteobacteria bacterium]|nr:sarcosine oxidase subunit alpha family protein [Gammaproteobacteria bacterium]
MKAVQTKRLLTGGRVDRTQPIEFRFDGKRYQGFVGDTLASALLANGVNIVSRSFKLHRPRGILAAGTEEPNGIMQIGRAGHAQPNPRATQVELFDGLEARSTKGWPSVNFDVAQVNDVFSRLLGAGFYYKTFMYPRFLWRFYERFIRAAAGFGNAPDRADPDRYEHSNAHCDMLIAGAGPAGLMAALVAARSGARVIIADEQNELGGSLLTTTQWIDGAPAASWLQAVLSELNASAEVRLLSRTTVFGYHDHNFVTLAERCTDHLSPGQRKGVRERLWRVRAKQVVLAQGAFERPLVFCNNDRPGIMLASAVSSYVNRFAVKPGERAVVFTNNDSAYQSAVDLHREGVTVVAVVDSRVTGAGEIHARVVALNIPVITGHLVIDVSGSRRVKAVTLASWDGQTEASLTVTKTLACDLLAMSGGWSPAVHLHSQAGGKILWDDQAQAFVPEVSHQENISVGACRGQWDLLDCLKDGYLGGAQAVQKCGLVAAQLAIPESSEIQTNPLQPLWRVPSLKDADSCPKQFIDFQNDTSVADIRLAVREGFESVEHVKRYTALGFGTEQGKLGNINGLAILAECLQLPIPEVGTTTFRPAFTPTSFAVGAGEAVGELYEPVRTSAIHDWHENAGAPFETVGQWLRPWYFPEQGEDMAAAVIRECQATRSGVGIMDASTLGKIDVHGPDATVFLNRIYTHNVDKMKIGRCAYGIMLGEDGMVKDDGVMARLGDQHYYLTTTTGGAAAVLAWLELWLQTEWPDLDVHLTSLTDQFSTIAVAGPDSRKVLERVGCNIDLSRPNFPFMSVQAAVLGEIEVLLYRVSFSGELAFEVNVDSRHALATWNKIMAAGQDFNITPYGTETMHVLRAEKGFIIVGQDTDGSVTPVDLKMNWMLSKDKDYIGKRSLLRSDTAKADRKQLVGLLSCDGSSVVSEGSQLYDAGPAGKQLVSGHVTSSYYSSSMGHPIALGLLANGFARKGDQLFARSASGQDVAVKVTTSVFYDAKGSRQNV